MRPASRIVCIWLWSGLKSTMQESWPACGGSTSVGMTRSVAPSVKSRRRAIGHSRTISWGVDHSGLRRVATSDQKRTAS